MISLGNWVINILDKFRVLDFLGPLALRLFLAPIFIAVGLHKFMTLEQTAGWFGGSLGLPAPMLMAVLAASVEFFGGLALLFGFAVRLFVIPMMVTMMVATFAVHWDNGWFAIASGDPETSMAAPLALVGLPGAEESLVNSEEVGKRMSKAKSILKEHGNYDWLTEKGGFAILNNGIEFAVTYFIMLLVLFFTGAGRFFSLDYWIARGFRNSTMR